MTIKQTPQMNHSLKDILSPLPNSMEMQKWDKACIKLGIPEIILMENAAQRALDVLKSEYGNISGKHICLYMGNGNNGGDAACLARKLLSYKAIPLLIHTKPINEYIGTKAKHFHMAKKCNVPLLLSKKIFKLSPSYAEFAQPDIIIDGLLGTGFSGHLRPHYLELIEYINVFAKYSYILSLDIPSGLDAHTGLAKPIAVKAHATISFQAAKPALYLSSAQKYVGKLFVKNIGIPPCIQEEFNPEILLLDKKIAKIIPPTPDNSYKNTFGHVLVIGGSKGLSGAPHLAARASLRTGAGLVSVAAPAMLCSEIKANSPDIMTFPIYNDICENITPHNIKPEKIKPNETDRTETCKNEKSYAHSSLTDNLTDNFSDDAHTSLTDDAHTNLTDSLTDDAHTNNEYGCFSDNLTDNLINNFSDDAYGNNAHGCFSNNFSRNLFTNLPCDWSDNLSDSFKKQILKSSSIIIGPGIGRTKVLKSLIQKILCLKHRPSVIIDADALYNVPLNLLTPQDVLTPHPGEAAFLLNCNNSEIQKDRLKSLKNLMELAPCVWVLKGANTLVGQKNAPILLSPEDVPTLAIAGSGDVLAGCIAALVGNKINALHAAALGVVLHAQAGKELLNDYPFRGNLASQIADTLPLALTKLLK